MKLRSASLTLYNDHITKV